jgi:hypothetical protein
MKLVDVRLAFRLQRFEIVGFTVLIALACIGAYLTAAQLDATGYGPPCLSGTPTPGCEVSLRAFNGIADRQGALVQGFLGVLPFLLGALAGAPLVAREIERGTSRLAWALAPSRGHWLVVRVAPVLAVVTVLCVAAGLALDRLATASFPMTDMANSFFGFGSRGVVLAARAVFVFAVGVVVGAAVGRVLPAMIIAGVIAAIGIAGISTVHGQVLKSEAVWIAQDGSDNLTYEQRIRLADGRLVTWEQAAAMSPATDGSPGGMPPASQAEDLVMPGTQYGFAQAREAAALAGASLVALGIGAFTVQRRRPA